MCMPNVAHLGMEIVHTHKYAYSQHVRYCMYADLYAINGGTFDLSVFVC